MGVELHITRAEFWAQNEGKEITSDEWLAYVASDAELRLSPENGKHFVLWSGRSEYEAPWLDWFQGNVHTKWPDTALYRKMLSVAAALQAKVQDDDGNVYRTEHDWEFDPKLRSASASSTKTSASWLKRLFGK
jgi:hypothetical protein